MHHSETYCIAMGRSSVFASVSPDQPSLVSLTVLHPRHKLVYFKVQGWDESWVEAAQDIVCNKYDHSYALAAHLNDDSDDNYFAMGSV